MHPSLWFHLVPVYAKVQTAQWWQRDSMYQAQTVPRLIPGRIAGQSSNLFKYLAIIRPTFICPSAPTP